jgi:membrane protein YqaA with SNARE-associated domain
MTWLLQAALAVAVGFASALFPLANAEAYAVVTAATQAHAVLAVGLVVALASGQTVGKLVLFETARRGTGRLYRRLRRDGEGRSARWGDRVRTWLARRRTGLPTVLASAAVGLPPLAVVSLAAGAAGQRRWEFGVICLLGRTARFAALALPILLAT